MKRNFPKLNAYHRAGMGKNQLNGYAGAEPEVKPVTLEKPIYQLNFRGADAGWLLVARKMRTGGVATLNEHMLKILASWGTRKASL